jgi:hypothetical protein
MSEAAEERASDSEPPVLLYRKPHPRRVLSPEDDIRLRALVEEFGEEDWDRIAAEMPEWTTRQLRDRWKNHLSPYINNDAWTPEEDALLVEKAELGLKWMKISYFLRGRTSIKCRTRHAYLMRQKRKDEEAAQIQMRSLLRQQAQDGATSIPWGGWREGVDRPQGQLPAGAWTLILSPDTPVSMDEAISTVEFPRVDCQTAPAPARQPEKPLYPESTWDMDTTLCYWEFWD